ncbi:hypothetical protein EYR40_006196 [Pleurotus pulmonarius]|nr:hypothetical protein EYR36_010818 [Pleurotus pulmonarius]KAF4599107.1 hypothetical protein EYR40_006196 [Pleurotus pulmonarius]
MANGLTALLRAPRLRKLHILHWKFENDVRALHLERLESVPELQRTARLSALTINAWSCPTTISDFHVWLKDCTDRLLRPDLLSQLTLELQHDRTTTEYPELAEYKAFSAYLAQFRDRSGLKQISIDITLFTREESPAPYIIHHAREVAKLKDGFAPILGAGVDIRLVVRSSSVLMECQA